MVQIKNSCSRDDDLDSVYSRKYERRHRRRLGALLLGYSRQTLSSRFGSRKSVNSVPSRCVGPSPPQVKLSLAEQNFSYAQRQKCSLDANEIDVPHPVVEEVPSVGNSTSAEPAIKNGVQGYTSSSSTVVLLVPPSYYRVRLNA
ncbi:hypothetical protein COOONC_24865 [Cooperia oncophora]